MTERPILLKDFEVRAILEGRKTQMRRVINFPLNALHLGKLLGDWPLSEIKPFADGVLIYEYQDDVDSSAWGRTHCPLGVIGDKLWGKETWSYTARGTKGGLSLMEALVPIVRYKADGELVPRWRSSTHMPRWASRITLEITGVRVERLHDMSFQDCEDEGFRGYTVYTYGEAPVPDYDVCGIDLFAANWDSTNGEGSWATNPWVWVIDFKRVEGGNG